MRNFKRLAKIINFFESVLADFREEQRIAARKILEKLTKKRLAKQIYCNSTNHNLALPSGMYWVVTLKPLPDENVYLDADSKQTNLVFEKGETVKSGQPIPEIGQWLYARSEVEAVEAYLRLKKINK